MPTITIGSQQYNTDYLPPGFVPPNLNSSQRSMWQRQVQQSEPARAQRAERSAAREEDLRGRVLGGEVSIPTLDLAGTSTGAPGGNSRVDVPAGEPMTNEEGEAILNPSGFESTEPTTLGEFETDTGLDVTPSTPREPPPGPAGPAQPEGPADSQKYMDVYQTALEDSMKDFNKAMGGFDAAEGRVDESLALQQEQVGASRSREARRQTEMTNLQGGSQFGGLGAARQMQANVYGDQLMNEANQNALEQKLGIDKGRINAYVNQTGRKMDLAKQAFATAADTEQKDKANALMVNLETERMAMGILSDMVAAGSITNEEEIYTQIQEIMGNPYSSSP